MEVSNVLKRGKGRPKGATKPPEQSKTKLLSLRLTEEEFKQLRENAEKEGLKISNFILSRCLK